MQAIFARAAFGLISDSQIRPGRAWRSGPEQPVGVAEPPWLVLFQILDTHRQSCPPALVARFRDRR